MPLNAQDKILIDALERRFTYHAPTGDQAARHQRLRAAALGFAKLIVESCPAGEERTTALQALDTALMFANAGVARGREEEAHQETAKT